jgi:pimeloyl-ACP methyl ester carboxylesterase
MMTARNVTRRRMIATGAVGAGLVALASGKVVRDARAQSPPKTFVLIHGAWCGGWVWRRVSDLLESKGHKVFSPTLTGVGERSHLLNKDINLDTHVTDIVNVIKWENLDNVCLVAWSYGGFPCSGALEQIGGNVSSIVWLDASKPRDGQKASDWSSDAGRKMVAASLEKGDAGFGPPKLGTVFVNEKDSAWANSKATAQPTGTYMQPIKLSDALEKVSKKTYVRARKFPNPNFDKALEECKSDTSWRAVENTTSGHLVMVDEPEWLAGVLLEAS